MPMKPAQPDMMEPMRNAMAACQVVTTARMTATMATTMYKTLYS